MCGPIVVTANGMRGKRTVSEIVSTMIILSLTMSSALAAYIAASHVLGSNRALLDREVEDLKRDLSRPWIHVVKLGDQYYLVIINPYDDEITLDKVIVDNIEITTNYTLKPHSSMIYRMDRRPGKIHVIVGGAVYEIP